MYISKHQVAHLKYIQFLFINYISIIAGESECNITTQLVEWVRLKRPMNTSDVQVVGEQTHKLLVGM